MNATELGDGVTGHFNEGPYSGGKRNFKFSLHDAFFG